MGCNQKDGDRLVPSYKETRRELHPSTRAILSGYSSRLSEGAVKPRRSGNRYRGKAVMRRLAITFPARAISLSSDRSRPAGRA